MGIASILTRRLARSRIRTVARRLEGLSWREKLRFAWALYTDRRVSIFARALVPVVALYLAMPLDLIPDFIPVLGQIDDLAVLLVAGTLFLRAIPPHILEEHLANFEAQDAPGTLRSSEPDRLTS